MKSNLNSFALYLMSLAGMIGVYSIYARFLVPIIEGPPNIVRHEFHPPKTELSPALYDPAKIAHLFPQDAWEHDERKILVTEQGLVMFKEFARVEGGYLEVLPFTLIMNPNRSGDSTEESEEPPTVLRCFKGARLKFDNPDEDPLAGKSNLESAWLVGTVDIYRPSSKPNIGDSIEILTSNVQIDKRQIHTIEDVQFAFGGNRGRGRQLHIEFLHASSPVKQRSFESVNGIKRIELAFLRQLQIVPKNQPPSATPSPNIANIQKPTNQLSDEPLTITCAGPFVLDMERRSATFNDRVNVSAQGNSGSSIDCNRLTVFFNHKGDDPSDVQKPQNVAPPSTENHRQDLKWDMRRLVADGTPATFVSDAQAVRVVGNVLSYDFGLEEIVVQRTEPHPNPVRITTPELQIEANQIAYRLRKDGGLGQAIAQGPGNLLRNASKDEKAFSLQWGRLLTIDPDGIQHLISIDQNCHVRFDESMQLKAQQIKFWLNEVAQPNADSDDPKTKFSYQPDRLSAMQNVEILSPQLEGETEKLTATWSPSDTPLQKQTNLPVRVDRFAANSTSNQIQLVAFHQNQDERIKKYTFKGNAVDLKLLSDGKTSQLQDLTAHGNVSLVELPDGLANTKRSPLTLTGHSLRCVPLDNDNVRVLVTGVDQQLAAIGTEQFKLSGYQIHLDQAENKLWVDGSGNAQIAIQPKDEHGASNGIGQNAQNVPNGRGVNIAGDTQAKATHYKNVQVTWSSGMVFNGRKIYFEDNVKMIADGVDDGGKPLSTQAAGEGVTLELEQAVNFREMNSESNQNFEIREVIIVNQVATGQRVFNLAKQSLNQPLNPVKPIASISHLSKSANGEPIEQQKFFATQITLDTKSGAVNSNGPGALMHYRDERFTSSSNQQSNNTPPKPHSLNPFGQANSSAPKGITFVRVNFDGSANANTNEKRLLIRGNVRTLYATVQSFDQVLDPDASQALSPDAVKVKCDRLDFAQWTPRNANEPVQELVAAGNAHVTSDSFEVTGDQVRYNQANDTMVIEGTGRSSAQLWYYPTASSNVRTHLTGQKMIYRLRTRSAEIQAIEKIDIQGR